MTPSPWGSLLVKTEGGLNLESGVGTDLESGMESDLNDPLNKRSTITSESASRRGSRESKGSETHVSFPRPNPSVLLAPRFISTPNSRVIETLLKQFGGGGNEMNRPM